VAHATAGGPGAGGILTAMARPTRPEEGARVEVPPVATELGERFRLAGHELYLVGGVLRDLVLGRVREEAELDLATDAPPRETIKLLQGWADSRKLIGVRYGTVGARKGDTVLEITTFREEVYPEDTRKPAVTFARDIRTDLSRRDFTINAMAVRLPEGEFLDPFGGEKGAKRKAEGISDAIFVWDTTSVPNGTYVLKIVASDASSNPPGAALQGEMESVAFDIDNSPPVIQVTGSRNDSGRTILSFQVRDELSAIQKVEYSLDAQRWRGVYPKDGIFDARVEDFELPLDGEAVKGLIIRAYDAKNNSATARGEVPVNR